MGYYTEELKFATLSVKSIASCHKRSLKGVARVKNYVVDIEIGRNERVLEAIKQNPIVGFDLQGEREKNRWLHMLSKQASFLCGFSVLAAAANISVWCNCWPAVLKIFIRTTT
ncbi:hypothetical protein IMY05_017G0079400 [Salix suchowensis]|nr:hypothetical protein IMY05_017G0079400 [Salix suchowensis]